MRRYLMIVLVIAALVISALAFSSFPAPGDDSPDVPETAAASVGTAPTGTGFFNFGGGLHGGDDGSSDGSSDGDSDGGSRRTTAPHADSKLGRFIEDNPHVSTDDRGAITLDASVLFDFDSAALSEGGKESVKSFMEVYMEALFDSNGETEVTQITVEGHTDTVGSRAYNQNLSEERAYAVMLYCIELHPVLKYYLAAKGCADDYPVLNPDGTVNMSASRRVCFVTE